MPLFFYRARDNKNLQKEGTIDALSLQHARDLLKTKALFVEEIHEATMKEQHIKKAFVIDEPPEHPLPPAHPLPPYLPLIDTLRLYAGWLLVWYGLIFAIGTYQYRGIIPFRSELIAGLASSTTVLVSAFGVFIFLMFSSLHKTLHGGIFKGMVLTCLWVLGTAWFAVNI
ncbi:hypothetical protein HYZ98_03280 [Candidatus Peregrinibacteria bacterium]|nr:hypothetical protein [Candidatus Peregrinibacteria bacterium]